MKTIGFETKLCKPRRAVEDGVDPADIYVERNGKKLFYSDLVKEL